MFLSTGTEITEHRLHCSAAETLVLPSSPLTDVEYREYCLYLHSLAPEQRGAWLAHRLSPITPAPAPPMTRRQFDEYCESVHASTIAQADRTLGQELPL